MGYQYSISMLGGSLYESCRAKCQVTLHLSSIVSCHYHRAMPYLVRVSVSHRQRRHVQFKRQSASMPLPKRYGERCHEVKMNAAMKSATE